MSGYTYAQPRPPALTVTHRQPENGMQVRFCADHITALIGRSRDGRETVPCIGFICSGQGTQLPASEIVAIEVNAEGAGHCNACDRSFEMVPA